MSRAWTLEGLAAARVLAAAGVNLSMIGDALGRFAWEVDLALWALVGRTPEQAVERLNSGVDLQVRERPVQRTWLERLQATEARP